ncbi:hypothetical protein ABK040_001796 [Willaertia magna]
MKKRDRAKQGDHRAFVDLSREEKRKIRKDDRTDKKANEDKKYRKEKRKQFEESEIQSVPRSIVLVRGHDRPKCIVNLCEDLKNIMLPYTAKNLASDDNATIKDIIEFSKQVHVTHLMTLNSSLKYTLLNISRLPIGPTLTFEVQSFNVMKDLEQFQSNNSREYAPATPFQYEKSAVCILNNFTSTETHVQLMALTFQNMFPPVDVQDFILSHYRRAVFFNFNEENGTVDVRHYFIKRVLDGEVESITSIENRINKFGSKKTKVQHGMEKVQRKLENFIRERNLLKSKLGIKDTSNVKANSVADLQNPLVNVEAEIALCEKDLENCLTKLNNISKELQGLQKKKQAASKGIKEVKEGEEEKGDENNNNEVIEVAAELLQDQKKAQLKLIEIGPRLTLKLRKVVEGVLEGNTIYHSEYSDLPKELKQEKMKKKQEKVKRRKEQEENVERKKKDKETKLAEKKERALQKFQKKLEKGAEEDEEEERGEEAYNKLVNNVKETALNDEDEEEPTMDEEESDEE